ncbi:hypothetical protein [Streptomyces sp. NPDC088816]|uniref:hypothetical protein n=1 Tax=unclassified Streptomyces TaxID=2593676 RepID=UPI003825C16F
MSTGVATADPAHGDEAAYRRLVEDHHWSVPKRYNMAADVADRHPGDRLALIFEDHTGRREEVYWQQVQDRSRQIAPCWRPGPSSPAASSPVRWARCSSAATATVSAATGCSL